MQSAVDQKLRVQRRLCVVGFSMVGKTAICTRFVNDRFDDTYSPTYENSFSKFYRHKGVDIDLHLKDTQGLSDEEIFRNEYGLGYHGYVLVYSIASMRSLEILQTINMKLLNLTGTTHVPRVLVGNKTDLPLAAAGMGGAAAAEVRRQVTVEQGRALAERWGCAFVECSAKRNEHIEDVFRGVLDEIDRSSGANAQPAQADGCCGGLGSCFGGGASAPQYDDHEMARIENASKLLTVLSTLLGLVAIFGGIALAVKEANHDGLLVAYVLFAFGFVTLVLGTLGLCGVRQASADFLRIYAVGTALVVVAEAIAFGVLCGTVTLFRTHITGAAVALSIGVVVQSLSVWSVCLFQRIVTPNANALNSPYPTRAFYSLATD